MKTAEMGRKVTIGDDPAARARPSRIVDFGPFLLIRSGFLVVDGARLELATSALRTRTYLRFP